MPTPSANNPGRSRLAALAALALGAGCGGDSGGGGLGLSPHDGFFKVSGSHQAFTCDKCHDPAAPSFAAASGGVSCAGCHATADVTPQHAGVAGFDAATASCIGCHKSGTVDHAQFFPIAAGTPHAPVSCTDCHGATKAKADLLCAGCHGHHEQPAMDAAHAGVTGYVFSSPSCLDCHPTGAAGLPANHNTADFPVTGAHAGVACAQCHGATKAVADVNCLTSGCHAQAATDPVHLTSLPSLPSNLPIPATTRGHTNYQYATAYCLKCHADGQVDTLASHPRVSHGLSNSDHQPFCLTCHQVARSDKPWAVDFGQSTCLACHSSNNPD